MASYLDKFEINTAVDESSKMDLSCQHITTQDWMQLTPVYCKEMVPDEKIAVNMQTFTRLAPMPVPTFGRGNVHNRAFFVPYRTVWKGFTDFITDTVHVAGDQTSAIASGTPKFYMNELVEAFVQKGSIQLWESCKKFDASTVTGVPLDQYDIVTPIGWMYTQHLTGSTYDGAVPTATLGYAFKLSNVGRQALKILNSLGYQILACNGTEWGNFSMSALPLMSFFKVYIDWYFPSAYYGDTYRTLIEGILGRDTSTAFNLTASQLATIFTLCSYVMYDSDYFVSAFDRPDGPNVGQTSAVQLYDISNNGSTSSNAWKRVVKSSPTDLTSALANTPIMYGEKTDGTATGIAAITQYALHSLHALTDYMKRHQLAGARAMDRYLARFGKNLTAEKLNRSLYIGAKSFPLQFGDIMSQADTSGAQLGAYAGKGIGYGENTFGYSTDEYGMFIIATSIVPTVGYYQGIDRTVLHQSRFDFWTPEFDQLGNQAIAAAELYVPTNGSEVVDNSLGTTKAITSGLTTQIFGYTPRYAEYKCGRDRLTGDFKLSRFNQAGDTSNCWHLFREFDVSDFANDPTNIQHSLSFVQGYDSDQFNRIFYLTDAAGNTLPSADHFYMIHNFDVASYSKMAKLYDTYEFEDKGKKVTQDVNGVKVN